jgi:hypothetical protein
MGEIIRLPVVAAGYPETSAELDRAESVLLIAIRWWVEAYRRDEDPLPRLSQGLEIAGAPDAGICVDALMSVVARSVQRPISVHCPRCRALSDDEKQLLHAAGLAQSRADALAKRALRDALLTAYGAEFALGPLCELGDLFAEAGLFLRRRRPPGEDHASMLALETWNGGLQPETTIH